MNAPKCPRTNADDQGVGPTSKNAGKAIAKRNDAAIPQISRPVLKYFGSKWRMARRIIEMLGPHKSYVEPYAGSASVLLQKEESPIEVINDLNLDVVTFFRVLRDSPMELLQQIELTPFAREEYRDSCEIEGDLPDIDRARLFFIRSWQGFSGSATQKRNGWRYQKLTYGNRDPKVHLDWHNLERLERAAVRLRRCQIECDDALRVIYRFDGPETAFYGRKCHAPPDGKMGG
jgi:DNA adenine methylase